MNHSSSKVEGLYTRMPTPVEKQQSKSASGSASAGLSSSSHSIIFRQKKKDSGYGSQGHLKLELVNYVCNANLAFSNSIQHKCLLWKRGYIWLIRMIILVNSLSISYYLVLNSEVLLFLEGVLEDFQGGACGDYFFLYFFLKGWKCNILGMGANMSEEPNCKW